MDKSKARSSIGVLRGIDEQTKLEYDFVKPIFTREGLTANEFLRLVFGKILKEGSLDFLRETSNKPTSINQPIPQPIVPMIPNSSPDLSNEIKSVHNKVDNFIITTSDEFNQIRQDMINLTNMLRAQLAQANHKGHNTNYRYNMNQTNQPTFSPEETINKIFQDRFNGATIPDYHEVVKNGTNRLSNPIFVPTPEVIKPTYVMQEFISQYNVDFRALVCRYIQNPNLVDRLSIDDNKLLNYIRQRYQTIGDMDTYITLCETQLYDMTLNQIDSLLMNLTPYQFVITKPKVIEGSKSGELEKYPPSSNCGRFKSAFLKDFDSCWTGTITEFETI